MIINFLVDNGFMFFWDWKIGYNFQRVQVVVQFGFIDLEFGIFFMIFDRSGSRFLVMEVDKIIKIYKEDEFVVSGYICILYKVIKM